MKNNINKLRFIKDKFWVKGIKEMERSSWCKSSAMKRNREWGNYGTNEKHGNLLEWCDCPSELIH